MIHIIQGLPVGFVQAVGWTLVHFIWQGLALAALLYSVLPNCRTAVARYNWALGTLALMAIAPIVTFFVIHGQNNSETMLVGAASGGLHGASADTWVAATGPFSLAWTTWLALFWFIGVAVLSLRAIGGYFLTETLRRRDTAELPKVLRQRCYALQNRLRLVQPIRFLQSYRVSVPMVIGWLRPVVLIPASAITGLPPRQLDALILHELAHILRLDTFANILLVAVETLLFYHPAVWWVSRRVRIEREHCCDDFAVSVCGDVATYVEALTAMEARRVVPAIGLAANGGSLRNRVARLIGVPGDPGRFSFSALVGLLFLCTLTAAVAVAQPVAPAGHQTLSFRLVDSSVASNAKEGPPSDDRVQQTLGNGASPYLWLKRSGQISGDIISSIHIGTDPHGTPLIYFRLTPKAKAQFYRLTLQNVGHRIAIVVGNRVISAPVIQEPIPGGAGQIDGNFASEAAARAVAAQIMGSKDLRAP